MADNERVYALAVQAATPQQPWRARLVCAEDGCVAEFDDLVELVRYLAQASLPCAPAAPSGIR